MLKLAVFVIAVIAAALGIAWLAEAPGTLTVNWLGYRIDTSVLAAGLGLGAFALLVIFLWSLARYLISRPSVVAELVRKKRERRGLEALTHGLVAVGSGDKAEARKFASQAHKLLPNEPLTALLEAQAAQLQGDRSAARRIFEQMADAPETEMLGLRGLFLEARRENENEAARQFAERAMRRKPDLGWAVNALFELQCRVSDWAGALRTLDVAQRQRQIGKDVADRRRAVLLTAQAMDSEETDLNRARQLALEAHKLAPDLVPAAEIAGRVMASQGDATRAARVIAKTWELNPHPDLAMAYAHTRPGDGPRERLKRVKFLQQWSPDPLEGAVAVATAAVEARDWDEARDVLQPYLDDRPPARVCTLMARIEGGQTGDQGRVREWLARAVRAPRDPAWTADGYVSDQWAPVSPITGELDAFQWKAPVELVTNGDDPLVIEDADIAREEVVNPEHVADEVVENPESDEVEKEIFSQPRAPDDPGPEGTFAEAEAERDRKYPAPSN
ncbi:MAG: heme biosynthesis protein HemY [Hyphomicrobiaceae bacterium]|nr:heme biosynthesis protein HemY [Hyphomicrobiaceae bacterium]